MSSAMPHAVRYHDWVFGALADHLRPGVTLEVGSGHGRYARLLAQQQRRVIVSDIDPRAVERMRAALSGVDNVSFRVMNGVDPQALGEQVDNVVLVNVLEHIAGDVSTLQACREVLRPGGRLLLFVPAFELLYSRMDEQAGHYRRYSRGELARLVRLAGFEVLSARYFNSVGFFGWLANKWLGNEVDGASTNAQIRIYDRLIPVLKHVDQVMPFVGQSAIVIGEKR